MDIEIVNIPFFVGANCVRPPLVVNCKQGDDSSRAYAIRPYRYICIFIVPMALIPPLTLREGLG